LKTIYFMRHGKAEKRTDEVSDLKRILTPGGRADVYASVRLLKKKVSPEVACIMSSPAKRAMETATICMEILGLGDLQIQAEEIIYSSKSYSEMLELLPTIDDSVSSVFIVAHNPVLSDLIQTLVPHVKSIIPTAGIVGIAFAIDSWKELTRVQAKVVYFDLQKKKLGKSLLSTIQRTDIREKSISFIAATLKELGIVPDSVSEEILTRANRRISRTLLALVDESKHSGRESRKKQKQNA
jgi:phosphohistidine phosphatase